MEGLRCALAFFVRDARVAVSYPLPFALGILATVARVLVLWLPAQLLAESPVFAAHGGFLPFALIGTAMMSVFMASYGGFASAVRTEQAIGTLESLLMTPASIPSVVIGSNLWTVTYAVFDAGVMLTAGVLAFGVAFQGDVLAAVLLVVLTNLCFAAVGILSAAFAVVFKRGDPFRVFVGGASFLLGGVIYPIEVLPGFVQRFSELLPITYGARALRGVLLDGAGLAQVGFELTVLAAFAAVGVPLATVVFARALRRARRDGSLLQY